MTPITTFDPKDLETKVKAMYRSVAENPSAYQFISDNARGASKKFGVKSVSLLAVKS